MMHFVEVLGGVFVFGGVAAANVAAGEAETEMDPGVAHFEAFFAAFGFGLGGFDFVDVGAGFCGHMRS
jgi:hypothetical protein